MDALHIALAVATGAGALLLGLLAWREGAGIRFARWRSLRARLNEAHRHGLQPSPSSLHALRAAMPKRPTLPAHAGADARAATRGAARLLFVGDTSASLPMLLATAAPAGPLAAPAPLDDEPFWRWWALPRLMAIEVRPPPLEPEPPNDMLWFSAMRTLARTRPRRPLDGIVLCASVPLLRADAIVADSVQQLLARRVHEIAVTLCLHLPVHVVVTGLQDLPGYASVRAALPAGMLAQAIGWRPAPGARASSLQHAFAPIEEALQSLRLGLLARQWDARACHDIHRFVEAVLALRPGLQRLHDTLRLDTSAGTSWQGLYLTASDPQGAFVADLFERFLPASTPLARDAA